ncbi:MAG: SH3 domain-containing protein [Promethearchaeati archaeon]
MSKKKCVVIKDYKASTSDPIRVKEGETMEVEFRETNWIGWVWCKTKQENVGWIPEYFLEIDREKLQATALRDYYAIELNVKKGEEFIIEFEESEWIWVSNKANKAGWIPLENVKII